MQKTQNNEGKKIRAQQMKSDELLSRCLCLHGDERRVVGCNRGATPVVPWFGSPFPGPRRAEGEGEEPSTTAGR